MKEKQVKLPGPDHPIPIECNSARVVVHVAGRIGDVIRPFQLRKINILGWNVLNGRIRRFAERQGVAAIRTKAIAITTAFPPEEKVLQCSVIIGGTVLCGRGDQRTCRVLLRAGRWNSRAVYQHGGRIDRLDLRTLREQGTVLPERKNNEPD